MPIHADERAEGTADKYGHGTEDIIVVDEDIVAKDDSSEARDREAVPPKAARPDEAAAIPRAPAKLGVLRALYTFAGPARRSDLGIWLKIQADFEHLLVDVYEADILRGGDGHDVLLAEFRG